MEEAADLITELRQRLIVRESELLHAADCLVRCRANFYSIS
jgi:hypothetical protein